jgi:hypothetical protein
MYDDACGFLVIAECLTPPALYANARHPSSDVCRSITVGSCPSSHPTGSLGSYPTRTIHDFTIYRTNLLNVVRAKLLTAEMGALAAKRHNSRRGLVVRASGFELRILPANEFH